MEQWLNDRLQLDVRELIASTLEQVAAQLLTWSNDIRLGVHKQERQAAPFEGFYNNAARDIDKWCDERWRR